MCSTSTADTLISVDVVKAVHTWRAQRCMRAERARTLFEVEIARLSNEELLRSGYEVITVLERNR